MLRGVTCFNGPLGSSQADNCTQPGWTAPNPSFFSTRIAHLLLGVFGGQEVFFSSFNPGCFKIFLIEEMGACRLFLLTPRTDRRCCACLTSTCFTALFAGKSFLSVFSRTAEPFSFWGTFTPSVSPPPVLSVQPSLPGKTSGRTCEHLP